MLPSDGLGTEHCLINAGSQERATVFDRQMRPGVSISSKAFNCQYGTDRRRMTSGPLSRLEGLEARPQETYVLCALVGVRSQQV